MIFRNRLFITGLCALALSLNACSTVKVSTKTALVTREGIASARLLKQISGAAVSPVGALADSCVALLENAHKLEARGDSQDAAGDYLKAAVDARELLLNTGARHGSETEKVLIELHNRAMARFAELWIDDPRRLVPGPYHLSSGTEDFEIELSKSSTYPRDYFDRLIPAEAVTETGMVSKTRFGIGATGIGIREQRPERAEEMKFYPKRGLHVPITLTMDTVTRPKGKGGVTRATFSMRNPMVEQTVTLHGQRFPVAADFSAPIAVLVKGRNEGMWGLDGFFKAEQRAKISGVFLVEPYDPDRIPVLLIHGLVSVPMIWRDIIPELTSDAALSSRYQFMVFAYPSSYAVAESALLLRENLAALREKYDPDGNDPLSRNMVVAGHSMGGILTHTLVADIGDNLWKQFSDTPLDDLPIEAVKKERIRKLAYFDPDPAVRRAVFFSAPHRGAKMAEKGIAGHISRLAKLPLSVVSEATDLMDAAEASNLSLKYSLDGKVTSVQSLEPGAPMVAALDVSPYKKGVIYHSVIGDRGRGDTPNSSDGVVEYWSSHQEGAASELIVPTGHSSYKSAVAIEELKRILREHAGLR